MRARLDAVVALTCYSSEPTFQYRIRPAYTRIRSSFLLVFTGLFSFVGNNASDEVGVGRVEVHHETL